MTVPSQTNKDQQAGNGVSTVFTVPFRILNQTHLEVLATIAGVTTTLVLTADYAVSGVGNPNTTVTFVAPPAVGTTLTFLRNVPQTQETDYVPNDPFPAQSHENALDKLTMIAQQQQERIDSALTLPPEAVGASTTLPTPSPNTLFGWASDGLSIKNFPLSDIATNIAYGTKAFATYGGNGVQTAFILPTDPGSLGNLDVSIDGVTQINGTDFTYVGTTLTFAVAPPNLSTILVRFDQALPTGVTSAAAVNFNDITAPAYLKTVSDVLNGVAVNVRRFFTNQSVFPSMLDGTTTFDATTALQAAIAAYSENRSRRGGRLELGRGRFIVNDTLRPISFATDNAINLEIVGEGWLATWLDFSAMAGSKDAIVVANDQQIRLAGFYLKGGAGTRDGIHFGRNLADGGTNANAVSIFDIADVRVQGFARDGVHHYNSYMGTMNRVYSLLNGRSGFRGEGFHTSLNHINCYARGNTEAGFNYSGIVYSSFIGCASDVNQYGFVLANARSTAYRSCGAEGNNQDGWLVFADNTGAPTANPLFVQECYDVRGVTLDNCAGYGNNILNAGYGGLLRVSATGVHAGAGTFNDGSPHRVHVSVNSCDANQSVPGTKAIVTSQSGGGDADVSVDGDNFMPGGFTVGAGTKLRNKSLRGKKCKLTLSADQTIATSTATDVSWGAAADDIGGCWSAGSPTLITVPAGVSRIRLIVGTGWINNVTGSRRFVLTTGAGAYATGYPRDDRAAAGNFNSTGFASGDVISVTPGDQFKLTVEQSSGGNLDLRSNTSFLTMEVIE